MLKPSSYFVSESVSTSQKVTQEIIINLLQRVTGSGVCVFLCARVCAHISVFVLLMCTHNETRGEREGEGERGEHPEREREREREREKRK